jgi:uncharacterized protein YciI
VLREQLGPKAGTGVQLEHPATRRKVTDRRPADAYPPGAMPRDPNIPDAFDVYTVVQLRRPADAPAMSDDELDVLQSQHLAYRAELRRRGLLVANGPLRGQSDVSLRGWSIFACDLAEAARLNDADPLVQVGRLGYDVMEWWVAAGTLGFPLWDAPVGQRRSMDED